MAKVTKDMARDVQMVENEDKNALSVDNLHPRFDVRWVNKKKAPLMRVKGYFPLGESATLAKSVKTYINDADQTEGRTPDSGEMILMAIDKSKRKERQKRLETLNQQREGKDWSKNVRERVASDQKKLGKTATLRVADDSSETVREVVDRRKRGRGASEE